MVELIQRGEPAVMLCHGPGKYSHGSQHGINAFRQVVEALNEQFKDQTEWMKESDTAVVCFDLPRGTSMLEIWQRVCGPILR